ncbi:MAG: response regulator [Gammaproteobacteria bacterium]
MKQVLIADDEPHVIRVLKLSLDRAGYNTDSVPNGEAALAWIRDRHPDVLITDIEMPRMTGKDLCMQLEKEFPQRKFLIFVLTSRTEIEHREWTGSLSNVMFLEKPVSTRKLIAMLDDYFKQQEPEKDNRLE